MPELNSNIYDVIIAGSGPSGASAAYLLSKAGKSILVLEKEKLPRYKTCGGGLTFKGLNLIPFDLNRIIERYYYNVNINDFEADVSLITKRGKPIVSMTMRSELDHYLIKEAEKYGAEIKDNHELKDINCFEDKVEVIVNRTGEKLYSKFFIAADGALSLAAKKFFGGHKKRYIPALEYELYVDDDILSGFADSPRFDFGIVPRGYAWVFPKKNHLSVGVLSMKLKKGNLNDYFLDYLKKLQIKKINKSERHGFVIPLNLRKTFAADRIILTGDAAGFIDPITAEGISFAILSGQLAAESLLKENMEPKLVCKEYNYRILNIIIPELRAGKLLSKFIYTYRGLRTWIVRLYGEKLSELMTDVVMGDKKYTELLKDPLNYFKLFSKWSVKKKTCEGDIR